MSGSDQRPDRYTFDSYIEEQVTDGGKEFADEWTVDRTRARFASLIYQKRAELGLSQQELAQRVGTGQSNISNIEHAAANITIDTMARVADAVGVDLAERFRVEDAIRIERVFIDSRTPTAGSRRFRDRPSRAHGEEVAAGWDGQRTRIPA